MVTLEENELLARVGRGTPMGELIRRYWVPAQDPSIRWDRIVGEVRTIPVDAPWDTIEVYVEDFPVAVR